MLRRGYSLAALALLLPACASSTPEPAAPVVVDVTPEPAASSAMAEPAASAESAVDPGDCDEDCEEDDDSAPVLLLGRLGAWEEGGAALGGLGGLSVSGGSGGRLGGGIGRAPELKPKVTLVGVDVPDEVRQAVDAQMTKIRDCWVNATARDPDLRGDVVMRVKVQADGKLRHVIIPRSSLPQEVTVCVVAGLDAVRVVDASAPGPYSLGLSFSRSYSASP